jgi:uncharacterized protein (DUF4213/DUF364 family)
MLGVDDPGIKNSWAIYDALIDKIPDLPVDEVCLGSRQAMVRSGGGIGVATHVPMPLQVPLPFEYASLSLRELAEKAKSWDFAEASIGVAAINAYWNNPELPVIRRAVEAPETNAFPQYRIEAAGKKVAVIGHFCHLETTLADVCELSILERQPQKDDYPDPACKYLLPFQDMIFTTGVTMINKTIGRLLELSAHCGMILVGPSVPCCPLLFNFGVKDIQGFVVTDADLCRRAVTDGNPRIFNAGKRISLTAAAVLQNSRK